MTAADHLILALIVFVGLVIACAVTLLTEPAPMADPWLKPPTDADRALVEACGGTVDETIAGAA